MENHHHRPLDELGTRLWLAQFDQAIKIGEWILDHAPSAECVEVLLSPEHGLSRQRRPPRELYELLAAVRRRPDRDVNPWLLQLSVCLLQSVRRECEAFELSRRLVELPQRYGWMRFHRAFFLLKTVCAYADAQAEFEAAAAALPQFWKAAALGAEALLCAGKAEPALARFSTIARGLSGIDAAQAEAWRGEALLWLGRSREALAALERAAARGAPLARVWIGAARLRLGDARGAEADLSSALGAAPGDLEGRVWRGEARRRLGDADAAVSDLDHVLAREPWNYFAAANRALALGSPADLERGTAALPEEIRWRFEWKRGLADTAEARRALLEDVLAAAGGVRRPERYLLALWRD